MVYYVYYNQYTWVEFHLLYNPNQQKHVPFFHLSMWHGMFFRLWGCNRRTEKMELALQPGEKMGKASQVRVKKKICA